MGFMGTQGKSIQYPSSEFNAALWYDVNTTIFLTDYVSVMICMRASL